MFVLAAYQQLCTVAVEPHHKVILRKADYPKVMRLKDLLTMKGTVPLKYKCILALKLSSSILQLMETPWLKTWQFLDAACFPVTKNRDDEGFSIDYDYPTVSGLTAAAPRSSLSSHRKVNKDTILLEFGIVLLELWHEEILEDHFSCPAPVEMPHERRHLARSWFDEREDPLPLLSLHQPRGGKGALLVRWLGGYRVLELDLSRCNPTTAQELRRMDERRIMVKIVSKGKIWGRGETWVMLFSM